MRRVPLIIRSMAQLHRKRILALVSLFAVCLIIKENYRINDSLLWRRQRSNCTNHVELCWLRSVIQDPMVYNLTLSGDMYDFTDLYKYKVLSVLEDKGFHGPMPYKHDLPKSKEINWMELISYQLEVEYRRKNVKLIETIGRKNTDFQGRQCSFNGTKEYFYQFETFYAANEGIYIYCAERIISKNRLNAWHNAVHASVRTENTRSACITKDYFPQNRTHLLVCPVYEEDFLVAVNATYHDISNHNVECPDTFGTTIKELRARDLKLSDRGRITGDVITWREIFDKADYCGPERLAKPEAPWFWLNVTNRFKEYNVNSQWHWFSKNCFYAYNITQEEAEYMKATSVLMIGDSHSENRYRAMSDYALPKLENWQSHMAMHLVTRLQDWLNETRQGKRENKWLVLNTGHHDLYFTNPILFIAYMSEVFAIIEEIQRLQHPPMVLWVQTTPTEHRTQNFHMFNNRLIAALNDWVEHELGKYGVRIVPAFHILRSMVGYSTDGYHQRYEAKKTVIWKGHHKGAAIVSVLLGMLCHG